MKMNYDKKADAVYINLSDGIYNSTRKITDAILIDEDKNGKVLGIEILDATDTIASFDPNMTMGRQAIL
jgi:uncharacterized protein YuzE